MSRSELSGTTVEPEAVSVAEAARRAGVGRSSLYEAIGRGEIPTIKFGKRRLVRLASLRAWLLDLEKVQSTGEGVRS